MNPLWSKVFSKQSENVDNSNREHNEEAVGEEGVERAGEVEGARSELLGASTSDGVQQQQRRKRPATAADRFFQGAMEFIRGNEGSIWEYIAGRLFGLCQRIETGAIFHSGTIFVGSKQDRIEIIDIIARRYERTGLFAFAVEHGDHWHILHDCPYSNLSCRCFRSLKFRRRTGKATAVGLLSLEDWKNIVKYHFQDGRTVKYASFEGSNITGFFDRSEVVQSFRYPAGGLGHAEHVAACNGENEILGLGESSSGCNASRQSVGQESKGANSGEPAKKERRDLSGRDDNEKKQNVIEQKILNILTVPIDNFEKTDSWLHSEYKYINKSKYWFQNAIQNVKYKFANYKLRDFVNFYNTLTEHPHWDSHNLDDFHHNYLTVDETIEWIYKLISFQYAREYITDGGEFRVTDDDHGPWMEQFYAFFKSFLLFLDKANGKKNTWYIKSSSNAGKTLFTNFVREFLIHVGQMSNWNRQQNFPLQTCNNVRLIIWNEPNYEESVERNLLKLLGGDSLNANIKHKDDVDIKKVPMLITSNEYIFPKKDEFKNRIEYHQWETCPMLEQIVGKKFHPLAMIKIIQETCNFYEDDFIDFNTKYNGSIYVPLFT